jgi:hypothetical protein
VSPVRNELSCCIPEDGIVHSYRGENLKSYVVKGKSYLVTQVSSLHSTVSPVNIASTGQVNRTVRRRKSRLRTLEEK